MRHRTPTHTKSRRTLLKYKDVKVAVGSTLSYDGVSFAVPAVYSNSSAKTSFQNSGKSPSCYQWRSYRASIRNQSATFRNRRLLTYAPYLINLRTVGY